MSGHTTHDDPDNVIGTGCAGESTAAACDVTVTTEPLRIARRLRSGLLHLTDAANGVHGHSVERACMEVKACADDIERLELDLWQARHAAGLANALWPDPRDIATDPPPNDPPLDVLLAYRDPLDGHPVVGQGCRKPDGTYVLTPEDEHVPERVRPTAWWEIPEHPEAWLDMPAHLRRGTD